MKFLLFFAIMPLQAFSQFTWEKTDSVSLNKNEIYSATKLFIADTWVSSSVIQNDDKDGGVILLKGIKTFDIPYVLAVYQYSYSYTITIKFKDNKYKMIIDDVYCKRSNADLIQPFEGDDCPKGSFTRTVPPCKKLMNMMLDLKIELGALTLKYQDYIKSAKKSSDW